MVPEALTGRCSFTVENRMERFLCFRRAIMHLFLVGLMHFTYCKWMDYSDYEKSVYCCSLLVPLCGPDGLLRPERAAVRLRRGPMGYAFQVPTLQSTNTSPNKHPRIVHRPRSDLFYNSVRVPVLLFS
jgi:hypothetical protein